MKFILLFGLLLSTLATAQSPRPRLMCQFDGSYFRVTDGVQRWEKYIGITSNPQVDCGSDYAFGVAGPYVVTFWKGQITEKYVGSNETRAFILRGHLGIAVKGPYLIVAKAGLPLIEKYMGGNEMPVIDASSSLALISWGSYLYATDGRSIQEKYVGLAHYPVLSVGRDIGAALMGNYLITYANGVMDDEYIGTRSGQEVLVAGRAAPLIALSTGSYFIVYDVTRGLKRDTYIGQAGKVEVRADGAYHWQANGRITRYNLSSGAFENL